MSSTYALIGMYVVYTTYYLYNTHIEEGHTPRQPPNWQEKDKCKHFSKVPDTNETSTCEYRNNIPI